MPQSMPAPADDLTLSFRYKIYYSNHSAIPAAEIAEALLALDRIVQRTPRVMRKILPGGSLPKAHLYVESLAEGSLTEDIIVALGFGSKKEMDRTLKLWRKKLGIDLNTRSGIIRTIIVALVLAGAFYAGKHLLSSPERAAVEISHNTIINIGAKELQMTPEELRRIVEAAVTRKDQLASDAVSLFKPAKRDPQASVTFDKDDAAGGVVVSSQVIATVPNEVAKDKSETVDSHVHVDVQLRALDLDSQDKGWAAIVPDISIKRLRLELGSTIKPDALFGKKTIKGTVEVVSKPDKSGTPEPRYYRLVLIDP